MEKRPQVSHEAHPRVGVELIPMSNDFPAEKLVQWFEKNQRPLPWRKNYSPYEVWISEIMAQQTRIDQMIPYFEKFMQRFPDVQSLAAADYQEILKYWEGLGYYSRARNLHAAAKTIVEKLGGELPQTKEELEELKGFGPYISAAVASIAFNEDVPLVDGNVLRVTARFWGMEDDIALPATRKKFEELLQGVLPHGKARKFNQGLMELGALICTPENPACERCPLQQACVAFRDGRESELPYKTKKSKVPTKHFAGALIQSQGKWLLRQREEQLLHGMWEIPMQEFSPLEDSREAIESKFQQAHFPIRLGKELSQVKHQYSHFTQIVHIFDAKPKGRANDAPSTKMKYHSLAMMRQLPLSKVQHKILLIMNNSNYR